MRFSIVKSHGSGNDFPLIDARAIDLSHEQWSAVARALADREGPVGGDGLLLLAPGVAGGAFAQAMYNPDGSEAELCLNGLRCTARAGLEVLGLESARVSNKASMADVRLVEPLAPGVVTIETRAGPASTDPRDVGLRVDAPVIETVVPGLPTARAVTAIAMPNPHLIAFVDQVDEAELVALGEWCEARPEILFDRANVSFVEMRGEDLFVRTHERGVGLTNACGSAMAASVFAAGLTGRVPFSREVTVFNAGGRVRGRADAPESGAMVTIAGNATFEWEATVEVDLENATASDLQITRRREDEIAAWTAAITK